MGADQGYRCAVEATMDVIGGKWKSVIIYHLLTGTKRFGELRRLLPDITQRMLTLHLRALEQDGIVHREVYSEVPPRVEYSLTEFGETLLPVLRIIEAWGQEHEATIKAYKNQNLATLSDDQ
jgi:DNA-binding HxlR family transcriptional regulator